MIHRRTPRAPGAVGAALGGIGAGAVLAMAAPLSGLGPALPGPEQTLPLRAVGGPGGTEQAAGAQAPGGPGAGEQAPGGPGANGSAANGSAASGPGAADRGDLLDTAAVARIALTDVPAGPAAAAAAAHTAVADLRAAAVRAAAAARAGRDAEIAGAARGGAPAPSGTPASLRGGAAPAAGLTGELARVVELTNAERVPAGCPALTPDPRISAAAQAHSEDMATHGYLDHDSRDGRGFADRITAAGYDAPGAENIAAGQPDAATVVQDWMESPGHRRNILDCSLTTIGVGESGGYWTQDFGR